MSLEIKILGQVVPAAATLTTLYTVPAATQTAVSSLYVCNQSAIPTSFRVAVRPAGAAIDPKHYRYYDVPIPGNDTFVLTGGISLSATDVVSVYATLATLSFNLDGQERV
jgi:hypothetical protein